MASSKYCSKSCVDEVDVFGIQLIHNFVGSVIPMQALMILSMRRLEGRAKATIGRIVIINCSSLIGKGSLHPISVNVSMKQLFELPASCSPNFSINFGSIADLVRVSLLMVFSGSLMFSMLFLRSCCKYSICLSISS